MSRPNPVFRFIYRQVLEIPSRGRSYDALISRLELSGQQLRARLAGMADTPANRKQLSHIIGIERWGQRRLQTLLGEPPVNDEYDTYRPETSISYPSLVDIFLRTRAESVGIAQKLERGGVPVSARALHNHAGRLSVAGWLTYFVQHSTSESKRIKK